MHLDAEKARVDAEFYASEKAAAANKATLTKEWVLGRPVARVDILLGTLAAALPRHSNACISPSPCPPHLSFASLASLVFVFASLIAV